MYSNDSKNGFTRATRFRLLVIAITFTVILAITIPLIAYFVKKEQRDRKLAPKSNVLVPLYVYPAPGAWDPLHEVISEYPNVKFTIIVNPGNGPGPLDIPDGNYTSQIPKLSSRTNVRVLGYVHTTYANRDIQEVERDIQTYAGWSENTTVPGLRVKGIFFDETPTQYDAEHVQYLEQLTDFVKQTPGLGPDQYVIHNPGQVPDLRYMPSADCTVVFEETYATYLSQKSVKSLAALDEPRSRMCLVMHSIPEALPSDKLKTVVHDVRRIAGSIFLTDLSTDYYARFSSRWKEFVRDMSLPLS